MNRIVIITGQTATGKTKLALDYASKYNGELINCDSRQIYKYLDIITGKDVGNSTFQESYRQNHYSVGFYTLKRYTNIWLYDVVKPNEYFSSFDFVTLTLRLIKKILSRGKTPIIVGGTYMYIRHLIYGVETECIPPDWRIRKQLGEKSIPELQKILKSINLESYSRLNNSDKNNPQRLIRKIEIASFYSANPNITKANPQKLGSSKLIIEFLGLKFKDNEKLQKNIEKRVEKRLKQGAVDEVKKILKMGFKENDPGLKTIGYRQLISYLNGTFTRGEAIEQWITKEYQYAKRQHTFMKKDKNISWREIE